MGRYKNVLTMLQMHNCSNLEKAKLVKPKLACFLSIKLQWQVHKMYKNMEYMLTISSDLWFFPIFWVCLLFYVLTSEMEIVKLLTPFLPGMAHSQFIKFMVPSAFFAGLATKPWNKKKSLSKSKEKYQTKPVFNYWGRFHLKDLV